MIQSLLRAANAGGDNAESSVYALSFGLLARRQRRGVIIALIEILEDRRLPTAVRAQAPEGIGAQMGAKQSALRRRAAYALIRQLRDPAPEVRFWSAFGLRLLGAKEARHPLRALRTDTALVPGWWTVGSEASDALDSIEGRAPPFRINGSEDPSSD